MSNKCLAPSAGDISNIEHPRTRPLIHQSGQQIKLSFKRRRIYLNIHRKTDTVNLCVSALKKMIILTQLINFCRYIYQLIIAKIPKYANEKQISP